MRYKFSTQIILVFLLLFSASWLSAAEAPSKAAKKAEAITTADPEIPVDELEIMLHPMTEDELFVEADGWLGLVKEATRNISTEKLKVKKKTKAIEAAKDKQQETEGKEHKAAEKVAKAKHEKKTEALDQITELQGIQTARIDRLNAVLAAINAKIGLGEKAVEQDKVLPYRRYIDTVSGIKLDVTDWHAASTTILGWLTSTEGGLRWAWNISIFVATLVAFWILAKLVSRAVSKGLSTINNLSVLLTKFIISMARRVVMFIGILVALAALEVNVGPLLAVIGAAGFVVAFALQSTLSNFASGIMIMFYRPFDVDDIIDVSGIAGKVKSMNLVNTSVMTMDNKLMIVPNNDIWGNVITNATGSDQRRIDLTFGIGYEDDIAKAQRVLEEIVAEHPLILKDPVPVVRLHELADSSVNFVCRPWSNTEDYWTVYWDVTRMVKERFDAEGISIPYPQHDVHILADKPLLATLPPLHETQLSTAQKEAGSKQSEKQAGLEADNDNDSSEG
ncbi:MAG: mechanosensitive ion channel [Desulfobulbaceae bacterium]|nr:mechanosensitive ion channel [Desulfobulbaceae bacterium]